MPRLRAEAVELRYPGADRAVIDELTLHVPDGQVTTIIGPNGCGKSTLLRSLGRAMRPASGAVILDGELIHRLPTREVARRLGILHQQHGGLQGLTVEDLVRRGRYAHQGFLQPMGRRDHAAVDRAIGLADLDDLRGRPIDRLSGGQRQRAWIAMVLAQETDLLLLDEPTTFLDPAHRLEVMDLVGRLHHEGTTVVMVLHDVNEAVRTSDRLVAIRDGRILASGPPGDVLDRRLLQDLYGVDCDLVAPPSGGRAVCIPVSGVDLASAPPAVAGEGISIASLSTGYEAGAPVSGDLDLDIPAGRIVAIVGPNACGKSTLLRTAGRLLEPLGGSLHVAGQDVRDGSRRHLARRLAMVMQDVQPPAGFVVEDIVATGRASHQSILRTWSRTDSAIVGEALERCGIAGLRHREAATLSGGERQRMWIAMALAQDAPFLLLDEPTTFLDPRYQVEVLDLIRELNRTAGRTIVMVLHDLDLAARYADTIVVMAAGRIVASGPPAEVIRPDLIQRAFGIDADVFTDPRTLRPLVVPRATARAPRVATDPPLVPSFVGIPG